MKKLILLIIVFSSILSCTTNSLNDNSNLNSSSGLLVKEIIEGLYPSGVLSYGIYNYNGNKITSISDNMGTVFVTFLYNGDNIIKEEHFSSPNYTYTMNYSNSQLSSSHFTNYTNSETNKSFTYYPDGRIIELTQYYGLTPSYKKVIRYYSQGNCIKQEKYDLVNSNPILTSTTIINYDNKFSPFINVTGFISLRNPQGDGNANNPISYINKNAFGVITSSIQLTYEYNSQNFPISASVINNLYNVSPDGTSSSPGTPFQTFNTYSYY